MPFFDGVENWPALTDEDLQEIRRVVIDGMRANGDPPRLIFGYAKTGTVVTDEQRGRVAPETVREWDAAMAEYDRLEADASARGSAN